MASAASMTSLADEVNCPICQGTLREPVTIDCGHNFCRGCLTRYCEVPGPEPEEALACPLCKEPFRAGSFRPNWQLASVVENIERLRLVSTPGSDEADTCREHGEKIYFFCEDDEAQLCALCREAGDHRAHTVRLLDAAAEPYRVGAGPRGPGTVLAASCPPLAGAPGVPQKRASCRFPIASTYQGARTGAAEAVWNGRGSAVGQAGARGHRRPGTVVQTNVMCVDACVAAARAVGEV